MRVSLQTARESRAIYRARLWELTTGDLLAGFGRGCMIFPATLIIGVTLFFLDTILGFFGVSLGVEMSVMLIGVGMFLSARHVYRPPLRNALRAYPVYLRLRRPGSADTTARADGVMIWAGRWPYARAKSGMRKRLR
jgi:hypothetical protein